MATNRNINSCRCKKTHCLQLYCKCFASGLYCDEACRCKECVNVPIHEETVQRTREWIEMRDQLSYFPKIHSLEGGEKLMPPVEKLKIGCKCKKSMCLQDYCKCYKAGVGCSRGCQCVGCENDEGKRGDNSDMKRGEPLVQGT